jgi:K+-transporting ATPase KdpF subunit
MPKPAPGSEAAMLDLILGGAVAAGLLGYLLWALLRPEDL